MRQYDELMQPRGFPAKTYLDGLRKMRERWRDERRVCGEGDFNIPRHCPANAEGAVS